LNSGQYFLVELPGAAGKELAGISNGPAGEQQAPAEPRAFAVETNVPLAEEMPLILAVEPLAPAWAQHIVHFLQTGELPEEQEEA
jgi:hypothetical protein